MKKIIGLFLLLFAGGMLAKNSIVVIDAEDKSPVVAAAVFSQSGTIVGVTDFDGKTDSIASEEFPLMIKLLGYRSAEVALPCDTVVLPRDVYELGEVIVSPGDRPILRTICYVRDYGTMEIRYDSGDTLGIFNLRSYTESMGDFYVATTKVKKFKNSYNLPISRCYSGVDMEGKTVLADTLVHIGDTLEIKRNQTLAMMFSDEFPVPVATIYESDRIKHGAKSGVVMGKHGIKTIARKENNTYIETFDELSDRKNHKYSPNAAKLLGMTAELSNSTHVTAYRGNASGVYNPWDLMFRTISSEVLLKGKLWKWMFGTKKPIRMKGYVEIYPVAFEFLTVDEAREMQENPPEIEFKRSPMASPLPPAIKTMVERADSISVKSRESAVN